MVWNASTGRTETAASRLVDEFQDDLSNPDLENELCQFVSFAKAF